MKNNKKIPKKYIKVLSNIFLWTSHTDPWCNMLQTVKRQRKYISVILSDEHTRNQYKTFKMNIFAAAVEKQQFRNVLKK